MHRAKFRIKRGSLFGDFCASNLLSIWRVRSCAYARTEECLLFASTFTCTSTRSCVHTFCRLFPHITSEERIVTLCIAIDLRASLNSLPRSHPRVVELEETASARSEKAL